MKIQNEQLEALLRQQELAARAAAGQKSDGNAFAAALGLDYSVFDSMGTVVPVRQKTRPPRPLRWGRQPRPLRPR